MTRTPEEQLLYDIFANPEREIMLDIKQCTRKPFDVEAVQVTEENMEEVAQWCKGTIRQADENRGPGSSRYVKVDVDSPMTERQTRGFVGDWVLYAGRGFKVYTERAFKKAFDFKTEEPTPTNIFVQGGGGGGTTLESSGSSRTAS